MDRIDEIFNVLVQYEKAIDDNDTSATLDSYRQSPFRCACSI